MKNIEMIAYTKATELARVYQEETCKMRQLLEQLQASSQRLRNAYGNDDSLLSCDFLIELYIDSRPDTLDAESIELLMLKMKQRAWRKLIEKIEIEKLMDQKELDQLRDLLAGDVSRNKQKLIDLPDITPESITSVLGGYINSVEPMFEGKIKEVYRSLVPSHSKGGYKTNKRDRIGKKVILHWGRTLWDGSGFEISSYWRGEANNLDLVFHLLDGAGIPTGYEGPFASAVKTCGIHGEGRTKYFKFKCYKNGNIHLEFTRVDLLNELNRRVGGLNMGHNA